jgi:hypothetical protein
MGDAGRRPAGLRTRGQRSSSVLYTAQSISSTPSYSSLRCRRRPRTSSASCGARTDDADLSPQPCRSPLSLLSTPYVVDSRPRQTPVQSLSSQDRAESGGAGGRRAARADVKGGAPRAKTPRTLVVVANQGGSAPYSRAGYGPRQHRPRRSRYLWDQSEL